MVKLAFLFFSSGVGALVLQVVWQRRLSLLFGNTVQATAAVLAAFLGCLALGSALFGPIADRVRRPVRLFGILEVAVGVGALVSLALSPLVGELGAQAYRTFGGETVGLTAVRCLLALLLIAPATLPMGGTLPAIAKTVAAHRKPGEALGVLYGINTLGAATGSMLAAFVLVLVLGFRTTWIAAAGLDLAIGLLVLFAGARLEPAGTGAGHAAPAEPAPPEEPATPAGAARPAASLAGLHALVFVSGGVLLALEVLWTRALVLHLGSHVATFALMLATVLIGLGAGGIVGGWIGDRARDRLLLAGIAAVLAAVTGAWGVAQLRGLGDLMTAVVAGLGVSGYWGTVFVQSIAAAQVALLPSFLGGLVLPLVWREAHAAERQGSRVGFLTAASTAGTLVGSLGAGFLLVPSLGVGRSFAVVLAIELAIGVAVIFVRRRMALGVGAIVVGALLTFGLLRSAAPLEGLLLAAGVFTDEGTEILFHEDGLHGLITVEDRNDGETAYRSLSVNGVNVAGTHPELIAVQKMQAHVPLLLHAAPRSILHIGVGSGGTAASASLHDLETIDVVELNPRVPVAADRFMEAVNHGVLTTEPRLNLVYGDGRTHLMATGRSYDVILSDSIHPRFAGNGALYSRDYYEICRAKLSPGGVVSQWLPLYGLPPEAFLGIVRAFVEVFPDSTIWYLYDTPNPHTILVGARDGFQFGPMTVADRLADPEIAADLAEIGVIGASGFLDNFLAGARGLERLVRDAPVHTDDRPIVEFTAGRWHGEHFRYYYLWTWHQNFGRLLDVRERWAGAAGMPDPVGERLQGYLVELGRRLP